MTKLFIGLLCSTFLLLSGCNTVKGFGKDVSQGGQEIERAASQ
nr:entericidin A/B family lipoprotein [Legionella nagasakiensis]